MSKLISLNECLKENYGSLTCSKEQVLARYQAVAREALQRLCAHSSETRPAPAVWCLQTIPFQAAEKHLKMSETAAEVSSTTTTKLQKG